ncbi:MAG: SCO family protein, partial [Gammaproteobacteria bacterium]|nr:SCO family protein [Gammaproteobacteria bacterium]
VARAAESEAQAEARARQYFTDLEVVDQNGRRLRFYSDVLKDRVVLINFIYTNCPDACPLITQKLKQIRSLLVPAVSDDIWFVSMSTDPERDTPEAMKEFAKAQGVDESRWLFITGPKQNLIHLIKKLGQYTENVESHSTLMLAGNTRTRHWKRVMPMIQPPGVAAQLRDMAEDKSG